MCPQTHITGQLAAQHEKALGSQSYPAGSSQYYCDEGKLRQIACAAQERDYHTITHLGCGTWTESDGANNMRNRNRER